MSPPPVIFTAGAVLWLYALSLPAQEPTLPVSVVKADSATVYDEIPLTGSLESRRVSRLSPKETGFVAEVLVDEGDYVAGDEVLLRLDSVMAEIELERVKAEVREAEARLAEAKRQRDEAKRLLDKNHIASSNYESLVSEVAIATAVLQRLQTNLKRQREVLERHTIRAPFDGVIGDKLIEAGQWVETGTALFQLVEIDVLWISVPVPQHYFGRIEVGSPAGIRFDALPDYNLNGTVTAKTPVGDEAGRTFPIRILVDNEDRRLAPGMSARVRLRLSDSKKTATLLVPRDAIVQKPDGSATVWVVEQESGQEITRPVSVQTGRSFRGNVEIIGGDISVGDRLVVRGNEILEPGQSVRIHREVELEI